MNDSRKDKGNHRRNRWGLPRENNTAGLMLLTTAIYGRKWLRGFSEDSIALCANTIRLAAGTTAPPLGSKALSEKGSKPLLFHEGARLPRWDGGARRASRESLVVEITSGEDTQASVVGHYSYAVVMTAKQSGIALEPEKAVNEKLLAKHFTQCRLQSISITHTDTFTYTQDYTHTSKQTGGLSLTHVCISCGNLLFISMG